MNIEERQAIRKEALIQWTMDYTAWLESIGYYNYPQLERKEATKHARSRIFDRQTITVT